MSSSANYNGGVTLLLLASGLGLILWSGWGFVDRHFPGLLGRLQVTDLVAADSTDQRAKPAVYNVDRIVAAHLFGIADQKKVANRTDDAPQTKLKLQLIGVLGTGNEDYARAMIQVESKGMKTYAIGDSIDGTDAQLHKVESEKVILDREGNFESLVMVREKTKISRGKPDTG